MSIPEVDMSADEQAETLVVIDSFSDKAFAEAAVSLLASEGIEAWVRADDAGGELPNLDFAKGARVLVLEADAERARGILNAAAEE
jgi:hypothetical protein